MQTSEALKRVFGELNLQLIKEVIFNTEGGPIEAVEMMRVSEYLVTTIVHAYIITNMLFMLCKFIY